MAAVAAARGGPRRISAGQVWHGLLALLVIAALVTQVVLTSQPSAVTGMGGGLDDVALKRLARVGIVPLTEEEGLQLFDAALRINEPAVVPVHLNLATLRKFARAGVLPPLLRRLVRATGRGGQSRERSLARRLETMPEEEWSGAVLQTLRAEVAAVLGYDSADMIDPQVEFKGAGFDSLAAVELYNRMCQTTAMRIPTTMGFDYPTPKQPPGTSPT